jgi:hypothetical protein
MEILRQYNLAQRRKGAKKVLARPAILKSYFGDDAIVTVITIRHAPVTVISRPQHHCNYRN